MVALHDPPSSRPSASGLCPHETLFTIHPVDPEFHSRVPMCRHLPTSWVHMSGQTTALQSSWLAR